MYNNVNGLVYNNVNVHITVISTHRCEHSHQCILMSMFTLLIIFQSLISPYYACQCEYWHEYTGKKNTNHCFRLSPLPPVADLCTFLWGMFHPRIIKADKNWTQKYTQRMTQRNNKTVDYSHHSQYWHNSPDCTASQHSNTTAASQTIMSDLHE